MNREPAKIPWRTFSRRIGLVALCAMAVLAVQGAQAGAVTNVEAKREAAQHVVMKSGLRVYAIGRISCRPRGREAYLCVVRITAEGPRSLRGCRVKVGVDSTAGTRILAHRCRSLNRPFLSNREAGKAARRVAAGTGLGTPRGGSYGRVSMTRYSFEFYWIDEEKSCVQQVKVALIDGKVETSASEPACVPAAPWPT